MFNAGLMAAVVAAPDDDAARHVFGDWCEEHGSSARNALIKAQLALLQRTGDRAYLYGPRWWEHADAGPLRRTMIAALKRCGQEVLHEELQFQTLPENVDVNFVGGFPEHFRATSADALQALDRQVGGVRPLRSLSIEGTHLRDISVEDFLAVKFLRGVQRLHAHRIEGLRMSALLKAHPNPKIRKLKLGAISPGDVRHLMDCRALPHLCDLSIRLPRDQRGYSIRRLARMCRRLECFELENAGVLRRRLLELPLRHMRALSLGVNHNEQELIVELLDRLKGSDLHSLTIHLYSDNSPGRGPRLSRSLALALGQCELPLARLWLRGCMLDRGSCEPLASLLARLTELRLTVCAEQQVGCIEALFPGKSPSPLKSLQIRIEEELSENEDSQRTLRYLSPLRFPCLRHAFLAQNLHVNDLLRWGSSFPELLALEVAGFAEPSDPPQEAVDSLRSKLTDLRLCINDERDRDDMLNWATNAFPNAWVSADDAVGIYGPYWMFE